MSEKRRRPPCPKPKVCPGCGTMIMATSVRCHRCNNSSPEWRAQLSLSRQGHPVSVEARNKIAASKIGELNPMKRPEVLAKQRVSMNKPEVKAKFSGPNNPRYRNGKGSGPYDWKFEKLSKQVIAEAEGVCAWSGCVNPAKCTHHINRCCQDNRRVNLLPLCRKHHGTVHTPSKAEYYEFVCGQIQSDRGIQ